MYGNIYFRKPRTRSSPTRIPDTVAMDTYMMVGSAPGGKEGVLLVPKDVVTGLGVEELESKLPLSEAVV